MLRYANEAEPSEDGVSLAEKTNIANFPHVVLDSALLDMARVA